MKEFFPYKLSPVNMPVDISFVFADERPAGKHGFLTAKGSRFSFEDGAPARFWGVNFNGGACFPEHDFAKKVARRLAQTGVNLVRFHQLDGEWNCPNIFQYAKGAHMRSNRALDETSMDRLDYLIHCFREEGIYVYLDLITYRRFKTLDGCEKANELQDAARPYSIYNKTMVGLQKEYACQLFEHYNPYNGCCYKDDPVIVLTEIMNEGDLFSRQFLLEPYAAEFRQLMRGWLEEQEIEYDWEGCDLSSEDAPLLAFKIFMQKKYFNDMKAYLREIGVRIPITGTNWSKHPGIFAASEDMDFMDSHEYHYDWRWGERDKRCGVAAITKTKEACFDTLSHMRRFDKPFFVSEWDLPWPCEWRAESPILFAALGSFQGWDGWAIHTYSYLPAQEDNKILGKEMLSDAINGVPYREGVFSVWNDPAKYGLFYHAALITRRGDVSEANEKVAVQVDPIFGSVNTGEVADNIANLTCCAKGQVHAEDTMREAYRCVAETHKLATTLRADEDADVLVSENVSPVDVAKNEVRSDNGQMYRSWEKNFGFIDSPMTKCAYGFLEKNGPVELNCATIDCKTDFAVIAMSSLTEDPIEKSDNILLTTVGRAENTDIRFDRDRLVDFGHAPVIVENIVATISIHTTMKTATVWAVSPEGCYGGSIPVTCENGVLSFTVGENWRSMYYLIQAE